MDFALSPGYDKMNTAGLGMWLSGRSLSVVQKALGLMPCTT